MLLTMVTRKKRIHVKEQAGPPSVTRLWTLYAFWDRLYVHVFIMRAHAYCSARGNDLYRIMNAHVQWVKIVNVIICVHIQRGLRRAKRSMCNQETKKYKCKTASNKSSLEHIPRAQPRICMHAARDSEYVAWYIMLLSLWTLVLPVSLYLTFTWGYTIINFQFCRKRQGNCWLCCCRNFASIVCILLSIRAAFD